MITFFLENVHLVCRTLLFCGWCNFWKCVFYKCSGTTCSGRGEMCQSKNFQKQLPFGWGI